MVWNDSAEAVVPETAVRHGVEARPDTGQRLAEVTLGVGLRARGA
jgi:hypothetical protein